MGFIFVHLVTLSSSSLIVTGDSAHLARGVELLHAEREARDKEHNKR